MATPTKRSKTADDSRNNASSMQLLIPTIINKASRELDLRSMTDADLKELHEKDPFSYYSIPGFREAEISLMEVDLSKAKESAHIVSRKTRLSVECHASVLLDGLFDDDEDWDSLEGSEKCLGDIDVFLSALFFKSQ